MPLRSNTNYTDLLFSVLTMSSENFSLGTNHGLGCRLDLQAEPQSGEPQEGEPEALVPSLGSALPLVMQHQLRGSFLFLHHRYNKT